MEIVFHPIGYVFVEAEKVPRHWRDSDLEGELILDETYADAISDVSAGERIVVLFYFHQSEPFDASLIKQTPPGRERPRGVFSTCSPRRPNGIGISVLEVLSVDGAAIRARGIDMFNGTPILDIKPYIAGKMADADRIANE